MHLYIRFLDKVNRENSSSNLVVEWLVEPMEEENLSSDLEQLAGLIKVQDEVQDPANVTIIVPAEDVLCVQCRVPGRSVSQIRRALPFAVEEFLAGDLEDTHIAYGSIVRGKSVDCIAISKDRMRSWLSFLTDLGVKPGRFVVDGLLVPINVGRGTILVDDDRVLVRTESQLAVVNRTDLAMVTELIPDAGEGDDEITVLAPTDEVLNEFGSVAESIELRVVSKRLTPFFIEQINDDAINVLQSEFAPVSAQSDHFKRWKPVFGLAAAWVVLTIFVMLGEGFWARAQFDDIRADSIALYQSIYDERRVPGNPASTMRRRERQTTPGFVSFQSLVGRLAVGIRDVVPNASLSSLNYTDVRESISLDITVSDFDRLDALKRILEVDGLLVELPTAEQQGESVRARIRLGAKAL